MQIYAPTATSDVVEKDAFYEQLHAVQGRFPEGDIGIVMGDLNTKMGSDNNLLGLVMGNTV